MSQECDCITGGSLGMASTTRRETPETIVAAARARVAKTPGALDRSLVTAAAYTNLVVCEVAAAFTARDLSELGVQRRAELAVLFQDALALAMRGE